MNKISMITFSAFLSLFTFSACETIPKGAVPVKPFNKEKYLGTWYEIARKDFKFERDLNNVTATYTLNNNGTIKVVNRGFNFKTKRWKEAVGKAKLAGAVDEAKLKISFFGPFYAAYNVIAIDSEYKYALVVGKNTDYLWILSRETTIPDDTKEQYLKIAADIGFITSDLVWTSHDLNTKNK